MRKNHTRLQALIVTAGAMAVAGGMLLPRPVRVSTNTSGATEIDRARLSETYSKLPLQFEPNRGQTNESVKFLSRGRGYGLFLTSTEVVLVLSKASAENQNPAVVRMQLRGANPKPEVTGESELPSKANYLIG